MSTMYTHFLLIVNLLIGISSCNYPATYPPQGFRPGPPVNSFFPSSGNFPPSQQLNSATGFNGSPYGSPPVNPPRMYATRIQLACEAFLYGQGTIRWIRQGSLSTVNTPTVITDGVTSLDPLHYSVTMDNLPNGITRSILTLNNLEPDLNQAIYYCQQWSGISTAISKELYILGHRQFINANMAYQAADTFVGMRSAMNPEIEAIQAELLVTPKSAKLDKNETIYHNVLKRNRLVAHNLTLPSTAEIDNNIEKPIP